MTSQQYKNASAVIASAVNGEAPKLEENLQILVDWLLKKDRSDRKIKQAIARTASAILDSVEETLEAPVHEIVKKTYKSGKLKGASSLRRKAKTAGCPKQATGSYIRFTQDCRKTLKDQDIVIPPTEFSKLCGAAWNGRLSEDVSEHYQAFHDAGLKNITKRKKTEYERAYKADKVVQDKAIAEYKAANPNMYDIKEPAKVKVKSVNALTLWRGHCKTLAEENGNEYDDKHTLAQWKKLKDTDPELHKQYQEEAKKINKARKEEALDKTKKTKTPKTPAIVEDSEDDSVYNKDTESESVAQDSE